MINRRDFLKGSALATVGLGVGRSVFAGVRPESPAPGLAGHGSPPAPAHGRDGARAAGRAAPSTATAEKILVVVNLFGGNDGLNTVIPTSAGAYDRYRILRPKLRYDMEALLPLNGEPDFRLNPGMVAFQRLFNQGKLAIINGVGVPDTAAGLFSHEAGQYEFQSCDIAHSPTQGPPTGWLGRYLDTVQRGAVTPGIDLGGGRLMLTGASHHPISIDSLQRFQLQVTGFDEPRRRASYTSIMNAPSPGGGIAEASRQYRRQALEESGTIQAATASYAASVTYPDTDLGFHLGECAKIIYGNVGTRALAVGTGGFDTHSDQNARGSGQQGYHESLLGDVSEAVSTFYMDLVNQGLSERVLILTISEFGRRAYENGDKGTDHGFASVAFAVGDAVQGGIYGSYSSLDDLVLDGNLAPTTDFRAVYASSVGSFLGADPVPIVGGSFPLVPFV